MMAELDQLQQQLTAVQQQPLPTDESQANDMISRYEVHCLMTHMLL